MEWLRFFKNAPKEGDDTMEANYTNPVIHKACDVLRELSADEQNRIKTEERDRQLRYEKSVMLEAREKGFKKGFKEGIKGGIKEGIKEGIKKGKTLIAVKLLAAGNMSVEQIADLCELSVETVNELKR